MLAFFTITVSQNPEKQFGPISPSSLWIRFTDKKYQDWVGSFQQGWEGYGTFILNLEKQEKAFIVVGGKSFLIDISKRLLLNKQEISDTKHAILNDDQTIIYFSNGYDLRFIDIDGNVSVIFEDSFFDGLELIGISNNKLFAKCWDYQRGKEPFGFEIDLQTKVVIDTYYEAINPKHTHDNFNFSWFYKIVKWIKH